MKYRLDTLFSKLSGSRAEVRVSNAKAMTSSEAIEKIRPPDEHTVAVYSELLAKDPGIAVLLIQRENALALVDLLNRQPVGTTGILKDIDRSAIKETLNILSNAYMTALANNIGIEVGLGVPNMVTSARINAIAQSALDAGAPGDSGADSTAFLFETIISITEYTVEANLFIIFNY